MVKPSPPNSQGFLSVRGPRRLFSLHTPACACAWPPFVHWWHLCDFECGCFDLAILGCWSAHKHLLYSFPPLYTGH